MKYMKLFEQDWWEEESPFDNLESKLKIIKYLKGNYYITDAIIPDNNQIKMFNDEGDSSYSVSHFDLNPEIEDSTEIYVFDFLGIRDKLYQYKDLPKEIKDRLV